MKRYGLNNIILYFLITLLLFSPCRARADSAPSFDFLPGADRVDVGSEFAVEVKAFNVKDLYAYEVSFDYEADRLELVKAESYIEGFAVQPKRIKGRMVYALSKLGDDPVENGDVPLCSLRFKAISEGTASVVLDSIKVVRKEGKVLLPGCDSYQVGKTVAITIVDPQGEEEPLQEEEALPGEPDETAEPASDGTAETVEPEEEGDGEEVIGLPEPEEAPEEPEVEIKPDGEKAAGGDGLESDAESREEAGEEGLYASNTTGEKYSYSEGDEPEGEAESLAADTDESPSGEKQPASFWPAALAVLIILAAACIALGVIYYTKVKGTKKAM